MSRTDSTTSANSASSANIWTAVVVMVAGCVTGSSLTAVYRDRNTHPNRQLSRAVHFQLDPTQHNARPRPAPPQTRQLEPVPSLPRVPSLNEFMGQPTPAPVYPLVSRSQVPALDESQQEPLAEEESAASPADETSADELAANAADDVEAIEVEAKPSEAPTRDSAQTNPAAVADASEAASNNGAAPTPASPSLVLNAAQLATRGPAQQPAQRPAPRSDQEPSAAETLASAHAYPSDASEVSEAQAEPSRSSDVDAPRPTNATQSATFAPLPAIVDSPTVRQALAQVEPRVAELVSAGMDAGRRNAAFTARDKMLDALQLLAQTADLASGSPARRARLERGILAVEESADFARGGPADAVLPASRIVAKHRSQIVSEARAAELSHLSLQRDYLEFAQASLAAVAMGSPAGSQALLGYAKYFLGRAAAEGMHREGPRAVALCQAALMVDPANHGAANELGALFAQYGRLPEAREMLLRSLRSKPTIAGWHNLAVVHDRLGETQLAELARGEQQKLYQLEQSTHQVGWVDKQVFAGTYSGSADVPSAYRAMSTPASVSSQTVPPTQTQTPTADRWTR
ncbi:MAG: hypothetical protein KDB14_26650 [Planctomycetales bacterium]|nr:hypothetical protein [Planctomycetales bacterium]